jgi:hypothetical protein
VDLRQTAGFDVARGVATQMVRALAAVLGADYNGVLSVNFSTKEFLYAQF